MKKPISIKIILVLTYIKLFLAASILIAFGLSLDYESPISRGIVDGCCEVFNLDNSNVSYTFGKLVGLFIIPIINIIIQLFAIYKKKRKLIIGSLVLELIIVVFRHSFPLFAILSLIFLFLKSSKEYFMKKAENYREINEIDKSQ